MQPITIADILAVKYLIGAPLWSDDGNYLIYRWNDGGIHDLWCLKPAAKTPPLQITQAKTGVSALLWRPGTHQVALVMDASLYLLEIDSPQKMRRLTYEGGIMSRLAFSPDGKWLSFTNGKTLSFLNLENETRHDIKPLGEVHGGRFSQTVSGDAFAWNPAGDLFLYTWVDARKKPWLALCTPEEGNIWRSAGHTEQISSAQWLTSDQLIYVLSAPFGAAYTYYRMTVPKRADWQDYSDLGIVSRFSPQLEVILQQEDKEKSCSFQHMAVVQPGGRAILFALENDGYYHHYLYTTAEHRLEQLTFGECEDSGQSGEQAVWSADGQRFLYASNRNDRLQRQIWCYDLAARRQTSLTSTATSNVSPFYAPDGQSFVYSHSDQQNNADLWLYDFVSQSSRPLTDSMPTGLREKLVCAQPIHYTSAEDWQIDGFLYQPLDFDPTKKYPAIVWLHGGPARQMRGAWHPSGTYAHFYAFNQYLAGQGYIVLSINYRGGIGYGRAFRHGLWHQKGLHDTLDVINGGKFLQSLPYIEQEKVAVYGLSYGGYLTLLAMTQYPDVFACGINLAGLWDLGIKDRWMEEKYGNYHGDIYLGGAMEANPAMWAKASPNTYRANLTKPLLSLQGTADLNVTIEHQNQLVKDCVALGRGAAFEAVYYPGESHTFRYRQTWQDAFPRMAAFFKQHLQD